MKLSDYALRYRQGEGEWQTHPLTSNDTLVGRGEDNDLILQHREVSRHHLRLRFHEDRFWLTDLESSNGTQVDGSSLVPQAPIEIRPGQMISVGDFTLVLEIIAESGTHISRELLPFLLRYRFGDGTWRTFPVEPGEIILGRDPDCDFPLNDTEVSRQHARLKISEEGIFLTDLGSTNGTKIENRVLEPGKPFPLQLGQPFTISSFVLQVNEPSRFYQAPSAISGRASKKEEKPSSETLTESRSTVFEANLLLSDHPPARAVNLTSREQVTLGRAPDNLAVLNHPLVSSHHAMIETKEGRFRILDLNSSNGVFINGKRIQPDAYLKDWDQIRIGPFSFVLSGQDLEQQVNPGMKVEAQKINQFVSRSRNLLEDISLRIHPNDLVAIVGTRAVGKSTLLKALSGIQPASHGKVLVNDIDFYEHYDLFHNEVGYLPQSDIVHPQLTPALALDYTARLRLPPDTTKEERHQMVSEILAEVGMSEQSNTLVSHLSKEQVKRVEIGCELLTRPRLFFLDEPTYDLEPGAEYGMLKLLRHLADRGRTIFLVTRATKNLVFCDKAIVLTAGGSLAFYGSPEEALVYFDQYRTDQERLEKEMAFEDIYTILRDPTRGTPSEWKERYLTSQVYYRAFGIDPSLVEIQQDQPQQAAPEASRLQRSAQRISGLRQFLILSTRNIRVLLRDKISLFLMLAIAPILGALDFIWGRDLYDPVTGDIRKIILLWSMGALTAILVGVLSSVREIVKEVDIYQRERIANLKIIPYVLSKTGIGIILALYQTSVLLVFRQFFVNPNMPFLTSYPAMFVVLFLGIMTGYLFGLLISAVATNQHVAMMLVFVVLVLQFLFSGTFVPLDLIPGGEQISVIMPARWSFESYMRITGLGEQLITDPCWMIFNEEDRLRLPEEMVERCPCMGVSIFSDCTEFPGILSPVFYDGTAQAAMVIPAPIEPRQPTVIPYPTAFPSPTPLPTQTLAPSPTPYPTPRSLSGVSTYLEQVQQQREEYQAIVAAQYEQYQLDRAVQQDGYLQTLNARGEAYALSNQEQIVQFAEAKQIYEDELAEWQKSREPAIHGAETLISSLFDVYRQIFRGFVWQRGLILILIQIGLLILVILAQSRKNVG